MRAPVATRPDATVLGDGSTARSRTRSRWRRLRWLLVVAGILSVGALASVLPAPRTSTAALAPDNPRENGARAVAEVLRGQGVTIDYVRTTGEAVAAADAGTTLLVTSDWLLDTAQLDAVAATDADLVLIDPASLLPRTVAGLETGWSIGDGPTSVVAGCDDPDATAAGSLTGQGLGLVATGSTTPTDVTLCFPLPGRDPQAYLYAMADDGDRRVTVLGDAGLLTNARVTDDGNAALALRVLGRTSTLVWYVPSPTDRGVTDGAGADGPDSGDVLPPVVPLVGLQLLVVAGALALWRGRRLGRVVTEQLPVVVRSAETTRGRGRLYRASRSYGHAAAALRAGVATRCAHRLGLPRSAGAVDVIAAVARATGRDEDDVGALLYGPPPTTNADLETLARRLDQLESEVHPT